MHILCEVITDVVCLCLPLLLFCRWSGWYARVHAGPNPAEGGAVSHGSQEEPAGLWFHHHWWRPPDEFLQVKNVLTDGPAAQDNKMASGE